jgi:hypothetical protein
MQGDDAEDLGKGMSVMVWKVRSRLPGRKMAPRARARIRKEQHASATEGKTEE